MTAEQNNIYGTLYLCATPIGNLEDMTPRALRMLQEADLIAAEDTRHTLQLLNHFNIKGRLVRYDEHSKDKQGEYLLGQLLEGKNVALVSDAGFRELLIPVKLWRMMRLLMVSEWCLYQVPTLLYVL